MFSHYPHNSLVIVIIYTTSYIHTYNQYSIRESSQWNNVMIDIAKISIQAGKGGSGVVSFHREKYIPRGGPDGGDGGRGGDVVVRAHSGKHMLNEFRHKRRFQAEAGSRGQGKKKVGRSGKRCVIEVPLGTVIRQVTDDGPGLILGDVVNEKDELVISRGGQGGRGNHRFARPSNRAPILAEDGEYVGEMILELEMQILADIAVVGKPSIGKSSLLRVCSRARPDVAEYPFTTLEPVLGHVDYKGRQFVLAEIPGLIEGAHRGAGLGDEFLRHMRRTKGIIHMLDGTSQDVMGDYNKVRQEMGLYDKPLLDKPEIVVVNKVDIPSVREDWQEIQRALLRNGITARCISAATGEGVGSMLDDAMEMLAGLISPTETTEHSKPPTVLTPIAKGQRVSVEKEGETLVVNAPRVERIIRCVNMDDWNVRAQLWGELKSIGIIRALERARVKAGSVVRIGEWEFEWQ